MFGFALFGFHQTWIFPNIFTLTRLSKGHPEVLPFFLWQDMEPQLPIQYPCLQPYMTTSKFITAFNHLIHIFSSCEWMSEWINRFVPQLYLATQNAWWVDKNSLPEHKRKLARQFISLDQPVPKMFVAQQQTSHRSFERGQKRLVVALTYSLCVALLRILCHHFDPQGEVWVYGHHIGSGKAWGDTATYRTVGTDKEQGGRKKELWRKQKKKAQRWDETEEETETKSVKGDKFIQAYMSNDVQVTTGLVKACHPMLWEPRLSFNQRWRTNLKLLDWMRGITNHILLWLKVCSSPVAAVNV